MNNMTRREKVLIAILLIGAILAGSYYLLLAPQSERLNAAQIERDEVELEKATTEAMLANTDALEQGYRELFQQVDEETRSYFPSFISEKLLMTLSGLFAENGMEIASTTFSAPAPVQPLSIAGEAAAPAEPTSDLAGLADQFRTLDPEAAPSPTPVPDMGEPVDPALLLANITTLTGVTIQVQYLSEYADLTGFIQSLEAMDRSIRVQSLQATLLEDKIISGTLDITVYALPKIIAQDDPYTEWPYTGAYGRPDPFESLEGLQDQTVPADAARFRVEPDAEGISRFVVVDGNTETILENVASPDPLSAVLTVDQDGENYRWNFQIGDHGYPDADPAVFTDISVAEEDTSIRISLASTQRTGDDDISVIQMDLVNGTDLPVTITVDGDDTAQPRITFGSRTGIFYIR